MDEQRARETWAQRYALLAGGALVTLGLAGLAVDAGFATGETIRGGRLAGIAVNGWLDVVRLLAGGAGLAVMLSPTGARTYALSWGTIAGFLLVWGILSDSAAFSALPASAGANAVNGALCALGLAAGAASPRDAPG